MFKRTLSVLIILLTLVLPQNVDATPEYSTFRDQLESQDKYESTIEETKRQIQKHYRPSEYSELKIELEKSEYDDKSLQLEALDQLMTQKSNVIIISCIVLGIYGLVIFLIIFNEHRDH